MHEGEEVTPSTSSRKRRYKTSFRFSTMKERKRARVSKKNAIGITVKKSLMFNESNQELGNIAGSMTGDGISEIEEEKDREDEPGNIIMVSCKSYPTSFSFSQGLIRWKGKVLIGWIRWLYHHFSWAQVGTSEMMDFISAL
jgi:hypothetical protein